MISFEKKLLPIFSLIKSVLFLRNSTSKMRGHLFAPVLEGKIYNSDIRRYYKDIIRYKVADIPLQNVN